MRLTRYTDNALRCLTILALEAGADAPLTVADIARRMRMSETHLFKVVGALATLGLVTATRGRGGGVRLAVDPGAIRIGAVVRATEESFALVECFSPDDNQCPIAPACVLAGTLDRALTAFLDELDRVTLADLVKPRRRLAKLLPA
ncbi:MAG: Rrf2 family transcriptional regulator [Gemmatimonadetes bacterium]|nr:Rrf2 family transcriptional regulator [Gemmatimonadota bacterium]